MTLDKVDKTKKTALIVGCASSVMAEVEMAQDLCLFDAIYCVKLAGVFWPSEFKVWITLHPEFMDDYEKQRADLGHPGGYEIVAPLPAEVGAHAKKGNIARRVSYRYPGMNSSGSSGIYGAKVALDDGFDRVVLAGIPLVSGAGHFTRGKEWLQCQSFIPGFEMSVNHFQGRVRSMSGLTRDVLGGPTPEWLRGDPSAA